MNEAPKVSCIIAAHNAAKYLRETLDNVLAQRSVTFEVIVVDDGSTDETAEIAASYGDRLRLVRQENAGVSAARSRGIEHARGELIVFVDADDLCAEGRFATQARAFEEDSALEVCAAHVQNFKGDMQPEGAPIAGHNIDMMYRRSAFDRIGLFNPDLRHTTCLEWMLRARRLNIRERVLPNVAVYRRLHDESLSATRANESLREHLHVLHARMKR